MEEPAACSIVRFADEEKPLKLTFKSKPMMELVEAVGLLSPNHTVPDLLRRSAVLTVKILWTDTVQIRKAKGWSSERRLRLVLAGRELLDDESVCAAHAPVLHCVVLDEEASAHHARQSSHRAATARQHPDADWVSV